MDNPTKPTTSLFDVYLRLRPTLPTTTNPTTTRDRFLDVEHPSAPSATLDSTSDSDQQQHATHITIKPPADDHRKRAVEKFAFTRVYEEDAGQREIFESTGVVGLVEGVLGASGGARDTLGSGFGRDGLVATLGVTGSGKSHTILGSKSQRGITQLTLDLLFQHTTPYLVDIDRSATAFQSLCAADVAESQLFSAAAFLDSIYSDNYGPSRGTTPARGVTPNWVREGATPARGGTPNWVRDFMPAERPGPFPSLSLQDASSMKSFTRPVFDRLYPSLSKYQTPSSSHIPPSSSTSKIPSLSKWSNNLSSVSRLTSPTPQETTTSFLSPAPPNHTTGSRRHAPRISNLPTYPSVADINLTLDTLAEYAIIISMYEVHNDRIFDLLASTLSPNSRTAQAQATKRRALLFKSTELSPDRKVVAGLKKVICQDLEEALLVLETGLLERRTAGTGSNASSSRSHGFFCIEVKKRRRSSASTQIAVPGPWTSSTLTIVDLAGSERARTAKTAGATLAEAGKINESLMYLGQCMQMQSDNSAACISAGAQGGHGAAHGGGMPNLVPFRQCKLTELLFSNSFAQQHQAPGPNVKYQQQQPQKAIMIVTADPLGDFNATSQILRYSALAREVTVPRIPSVNSQILAGALTSSASRPGTSYSNGGGSRPTTPSALQEDLDNALVELAALRERLEVSQLMLSEETRRREEAEQSWRVAESRMMGLEAEIREEVWSEMENRLGAERRRWVAAREAEEERREEFWDGKLDIMARGLSVYEDEFEDDDDKENFHSGAEGDETPVGKQRHGGSGSMDSIIFCRNEDEEARLAELEAENAVLKERCANMEREKEREALMRSPTKGAAAPKMRVLSTKRWKGSGMGVDEVV